MNNPYQAVRCYEVTADGIRAVTVSRGRYRITPDLFLKTEDARGHFGRKFRPQKPRVAPRMAVGVAIAQEVSHAHA